MDRLEIHLLGSYLVAKGGIPLAGFDSNKVRALLAYLSVESDRPHPRHKLASLLWPDFPESTALSNLRYALANLRKVIGDRSVQPAYLEINPQELRFNRSNNSQVDVTAFESYCRLATQDPLDFQSLEKAAELYHGRFMDGFSIPDSSSFEEWVVMKREHTDRLAIQVFGRLADDHELTGEYQQAIRFTERQLELDPWREEAHRRMMRCLYYTGQRSAALAQYETCRRELAKELSIEPEQETRDLYQKIYTDKLPPVRNLPSFLRRSIQVTTERLPFVARQEPLERMHQTLKKAVAGRGQLLLVTGSPGQGKTALIQEFMRQALHRYDALVAALGNCRSYFGTGDPYLPFREILEMLTGQVEHLWAAGSISQDHARRMWRLVDHSAQALVQEGPALISTFISGRDLLQRASMVNQSDLPWLSELRLLVDRPVEGLTSQQDLFQQYWRVLTTLSRHAPILLIVDDLQWADQSSLTLLFHLLREVNNAPIMIIGAFRPVEGSPSTQNETPSLATMVTELRLMHGDVLIDLDELEERDFIDAYLDLEPNRLDETFRQELYSYTRGHPLFTVEMLYGMRHRGDLAKNESGEWMISHTLDWDNLPPRIDAAIAERLRQLPRPLLELLQIASIEGERFTAEVAAMAQGTDAQQVLTQFNAELDRHYKLVQADSTRRFDGNRISRYRFRHILYQRYLYNQLNLVERARMHEQVGISMEEVYSSILDETALELAGHFELAGSPLKAIHYLHTASRQATRLSSFDDAITLINKALVILMDQPETMDTHLLELQLLSSISGPLMLARGYASQEIAYVSDRTAQLLSIIPLTPELFPVYFTVCQYYCVRADYHKSIELIPLGLRVAEQSGDEILYQLFHWGQGFNSLWMGELRQALACFDDMIAFYDPVKHGHLMRVYGSDPGITCLAWSLWALWLLGYPEKARLRGQQMIELGEKLDNPYPLMDAYLLSAYLPLLMNEPAKLFDHIQTGSRILANHIRPVVATELEFLRGVYQVQIGEPDAGMEKMSKSMEALQVTGFRCMSSFRYTLQADAHLQTGQIDQAAQFLKQAEDFIGQTGERFYLAETLRVKGKMLLLQSPANAEEAEDLFCQALQIAHDQEAKTLELRAAMSLARLRLSQGRRNEARQVLAPVYDWFTEGFNTPDLQEAQALLDMLQ